MSIPSNLLACILPHTCMSVYYCDNGSLIQRLPGYESVTTLSSVPVDCHTSTLRCPVDLTCERDIGLVRSGVCLYHPVFWHLFSPIPV